MRLFSLVIAFLLCGGTAFAAISPETLREMASDGDVAGVDAALQEAHQQSLSGQITYDDLRDLVFVLYRTHPDMVQFNADWRARMPDSPYAKTVAAWAIYADSFFQRGEGSFVDTPPEARAAFRVKQDEAMALAVSARNEVPDFVPASDAVIVMQRSSNQLWYWEVRSIIAQTMSLTPNYGSLWRISLLSDRRWGGEGIPFNQDLCGAYHATLPEYPDLTVDACIVSLMAENNQLDQNWNYVADVLDAQDHPILELARVFRGLQRGTEEDRQLVMAYLDSRTFDRPWLGRDIWIAHTSSLAQTFLPTEQSVEFHDALKARLYSAVDEQLLHDPYQLDLLKVGIREHPPIAGIFQEVNSAFRVYKMRIALVQPHHEQNWFDAAHFQFEKSDPTRMLEHDAASVNAIARSGHDLFAISNYIQPKINQYLMFQRRGDSVRFNGRPWPDESELLTQVGCRILRLIRLFDHVATEYPDHRNQIDGFRAKWQLQSIAAEIGASGLCGHVTDAAIEDLLFEEIAIDRRAYLTIPPD